MCIRDRCYVLEDGARVLSGRGMQTAIGFGGQASTHGLNFRVFLELDAIKPFVNNELTMALDSPVCFVRPGRFQTETLPAFSTVEK